MPVLGALRRRRDTRPRRGRVDPRARRDGGHRPRGGAARAGDRTGPHRAPGMKRLWPALFAVLALGACGKKGTPVSPSLRVPAPVADLRGEVHDGAVELTWTNPTRRNDATKLRDIVAARVYRTEDDGVGDPRPALLARGRIAGAAQIGRAHV